MFSEFCALKFTLDKNAIPCYESVSISTSVWNITQQSSYPSGTRATVITCTLPVIQEHIIFRDRITEKEVYSFGSEDILLCCESALWEKLQEVCVIELLNFKCNNGEEEKEPLNLPLEEKKGGEIIRKKFI